MFTNRPTGCSIRPSEKRWIGRRGTLGLLLAYLLLGGCATIEFTPITATSSQNHYPGKFVWHDLLTKDVGEARQFYGGLFGWSFSQRNRYTTVLNEGEVIAGLIELTPDVEEQQEARWIVSLSVPDVDSAAEFVERNGGSVYAGPGDLANRGRFALVGDPQGAQLVLLRSFTGDPEDREAAIGDWLWNELWSSTPEASVAFYRQLGEYSQVQEMSHYAILEKDGHWRGGVRTVSSDGVKTRWVPVVRVVDPVAVSDRAKRLGGRVLVDPGEPPSNGDSALIADPSGALFIVQRWPTASAAKES
jgi:predicted enzyme related to lactoylglutathione lyase